MNRERITITLDQNILKNIDFMIDKKEIRNRSHAIETLVAKAISGQGIETAVILAGGEGVRLRPITYEIPKPMIPVKGKPVVEHQINMMKKFGIKNIIFSVGYKSESIREYFGDGSRFGVKITYIVENRPLGTGGPLALANDFINGTFLVTNADTLINVNINEMLSFHRREKAQATILLTTTKDPSQSGAVKLRGNKIIEFITNPGKNSPSNMINAGLYIMEPSIIKHVPKNRKYMSDELFIELIKLNTLSGYVCDEQIFDIGTPEGYENAIKNWTPYY